MIPESTGVTKRYIRYTNPTDVSSTPHWGVLEDGTVEELALEPFDGEQRTGTQTRLEEVRLLAPTTPSKILAVGRNFRSHLHGHEAPSEPGLFAKMPSSLIGPGDPIVIPPDAEDLHFEGELVIIIGKLTRNVTTEEASEHVFGVTAGNDVSERAWQDQDLQWLRAKGSDSFGPMGPVLVSGGDYDDLLIETRVNGETLQSERSGDLIFPVEEVISFASRYFTLLPGDAIYTGTPGSTSALNPGDRVEVEVEGVGTLENPVVAA